MSAPRNQDANKASTIDATYKIIGSLPPPRRGRDVSTMDKFVGMELQGKIIDDFPDPAATHSRSLGFFLDLIFAKFGKEFADITPESLTLPISSLPKGAHQFISSHESLDGTASVELYDKVKKCWRWRFPHTEAGIERPRASCSASDLGASDVTSTQAKPLSCENQVALFLNTIAVAFGVSRNHANNSFAKEPLRRWLGSKSTTAMSGSTGYARKPDLILVDNAPLAPDEITWLSPKVFGEYTKETYQPASRIGKTMDTKAYLVLVEQPSRRRFILGLSIANSELRVHFYDHSGGALSSPFHIHSKAQHFLFIIAALAFGCRTSIGFDPTLEIRPRSLRNKHKASTRKNTEASSDPVGEPCQLAVRDPHSPPVEESLSFPSESPDPSFGELNRPPIVQPFSPLSPQPTESLQVANQSLSSSLPSPSLEPMPVIGKIQAGDACYEILDVLFSSTGYLGRGIVCYSVRLDGNYYVIKDHWVRNLSNDAIRDPTLIPEAIMMDCLKDIDGVPKLHEAWVVEVEDGIPDTTARYRVEKSRWKMHSPRTHIRLVMTPRARPLMIFKSKKELVKCVRDISGIIEQAFQRGIIHRDCSAFNAMIEDFAGGSRGFLLDWEFAVETTHRGQYSVGGTGTLPFISVNILRQLQSAFAESIAMTTPESMRKTASLTRVFVNRPIAIRHTYADDIESLLYVLVWIMVLYDGPLGQERHDIGHEKTFLALWSEKAAEDLRIALSAKYMFIMDPHDRSLNDSVTPYFRDLIPLVQEWCALHRQAQHNQSLVQISDVQELLDRFIVGMEPESEREIMPIFQNFTELDFTPSDSDSDPASKRLRDEVRSMDNPPVPNKRFKPV